jgi:hypothetical protein
VTGKGPVHKHGSGGSEVAGDLSAKFPGDAVNRSFRRAALRAFSTLQEALNSQSQLWAYVADFRYLAILCVICIPMAFFPEKTIRRGTGSRLEKWQLHEPVLSRPD